MSLALQPVPIPELLIFPDNSLVRFPVPTLGGMFLVTPDDLWHQLVYGTYNPGYGSDTFDVVSEQVGSWRNNVIRSDEAAAQGSEEMFGQHLSNAIARIACAPEPLRDSMFSLKKVFHEEERYFPRQLTGRDPSDLPVIYNSLCRVRKQILLEE